MIMLYVYVQFHLIKDYFVKLAMQMFIFNFLLCQKLPEVVGIDLFGLCRVGIWYQE